MKHILASLLAALLFCACSTPVAPVVKPAVEPMIAHDFVVVPRAPDIAAYPALREHVWVPASPDRSFVVIRVVNNQKVKPVAAPVFKQAEAAPPLPPATLRNVASAPAISEYQVIVQFAFDKASLDGAAKSALSKLIAQLKDSTGLTYVVDAYTDGVGTSSYNDALSARRAKSVQDYLQGAGVPSSAITAVPHGMNRPQAPNTTPEGRAKNRRATVSVEGN